MRTYLIQGNRITVHTSSRAAIPPDSIMVRTVDALDPSRFPLSRLVALWNALPDAVPVKRFTSRAVGLERLWDALQSLPVSVKPSARLSKQSQVITLLRRAEGARLDEIMAATGWQAHTVRGTLSGTIKKKLGLPVISTRAEGTRVYRIAEPTS